MSAIVVAWGAEDWLEPCVERLLAEEGVEVVVVDNGCADGAVDRLEGRPRLTVVRPGRNLGFAGGCNAGAAVATGEMLMFVNPDTLPAPGAPGALARALSGPGVGIATASLRLADQPDRLNSAGNEVHFSGLSWSGAFGEPAWRRSERREVIAASGAAMAVRREVWEKLGGFAEDFFAYYEDTDLSLRCWQAGWRVVYEPDAVVLHRYEFSRNPEKLWLLERNRLLMVLSCWSTRMLALLAPVLLAAEAATLAAALAQGWGRQKLRSWAWLLRHRSLVAHRRRRVQAARSAPDSAIAALMAERLDPANLPRPRWLSPLDEALRLYWLAVRRLL